MAGEGIELATCYVNLVSSAKGLGADIISEAGVAGEKAGVAAGSRMGGSMLSTLKKVAAPAAVAGALKGFYELGGVFDDMSDTIRVGTGASGDALDALVKSARNVGTTVPAQFSEVGPVIADLNTRLGLSGETLETVASQYLEAGRILGQDVDVRSTTAAFSAFGVEGGKVSGAMDQLFRVSQSTGVSMNDLAKTVQAQAPAMKNLGFSFEETASLAGALDKAGINSTATMAAMSKGLVTLARNGKDPQQAFRDVTNEVGSLVKQGKTAEAINLASGIFGTRGASQFVGAVQSGKLAVGDLTAAVDVTGDTILGVAKETADFAESWQLVKNKGLAAIEPLGTAVFNMFGGAAGWVADNMDDWIKAAKTGVRQLGPVFAGIGDGLKRNVLPIVKETGGILGNSFAAAWRSLQPAISGLIGPLQTLWSAFSPIKTIFAVLEPMLPTIAGAFGSLVEVVGKGLAGVLQAVTPLLDTLAQLWGTILGSVSGLVEKILPTLIDIFESSVVPAVQAVMDILAPLISKIVEVLQPAIETLGTVFKTVFEGLATVLGPALQVVKGILDTFIGVLTLDWGRAWDGIKAIATGVWDGIKAVWQTLSGWFSSYVIEPLKSVWSTVTGWFSGLWSGIVGAVQGAWSGIAGWFHSYVIAPIMQVWDALKGWFSGLWNGIVGLIGSWWSGIADWFERWVISPIRAAWYGLVEFFRGLWSQVLAIVGWFRDRIMDIVNAVKKAIEAISNTSLIPGGSARNYLMDKYGMPKGAFATGGYVDPRPGGALVTVAEAGQREWILPDDRYRAALMAAERTGASRSGALIGQVNISERMSPSDLAAELNRRIVFAGG